MDSAADLRGIDFRIVPGAALPEYEGQQAVRKVTVYTPT